MSSTYTIIDPLKDHNILFFIAENQWNVSDFFLFVNIKRGDQFLLMKCFENFVFWNFYMPNFCRLCR